MGMSLVAPATAWAAGVAMTKMRSLPSPTNLEAMVAQALWSFWAFCWSASYLRSLSSSAAMKPLLAASSAECSVSWSTPTL